MENLKSYLTFRIGKELFAANAGYVHNIIEIPKITEMPEMPEYMLGVINLRGQVLPVIDSRIKFGTEVSDISSASCIIVMEVTLNKKQVFVGMLVDAVDEVIEFELDAIKEPPTIGGQVKNDFITGVYDYSDKFILILEMNKVLSSNEVLAIGSFKPEEVDV